MRMMDDSIREKQDKFIELYNGLQDQMMQYELLLELAGETPMPEAGTKNDATRIRNCQTDSWFIMHIQHDRLYLEVDSDSLLIRGILSIYVYLLNGRTLEEVLCAPLYFMEKTDIRKQLSVSRMSVLSDIPNMIFGFCRRNAA